MTRLIYLMFLILVPGLVLSQTVPADSIVIKKIIERIESESNYRFYFRESWVDSVKVPDRPIGNTPINSWLDGLLTNTSLSYFIEGDNIILLNNRRIIENPSIGELLGDREEVGEIDNIVMFQREYSNQSDIENRLIEVGSRKLYRKDGESTIAGYVKEADSGKPVDGAYVYTNDPFIGTATDEEGFFSITIPNGKRELYFQSVSMKNTKRTLMLMSNGKLDVDMDVDLVVLNSVTVSAEREFNVNSTQMGVVKITTENIKLVPALLGERDIIRVATTTSGVQFLGEGSAGINVRGGKADQNLFLLDNAPVYNTNHFFGFFSVFNSDALSGMELMKNGIPVEYGGRLSSVIDIKSRDLNSEKLTIDGGLGPITSKLVLETPINKKGLSLMLGGRATYSNLVLNAVDDSPIGNNDATFYDFIGKLEQRIDDKNKLSLTGYYSFDRFQLSSDTLFSYSDFSYENKLLSLQWDHIFNYKLHGTFNASISNYDYLVGFDQLPSQAFNVDFGVSERNLRGVFDYYASDELSYKFGMELKSHKINPGIRSPSGSESLISSANVQGEQGYELAPFFSATYSPNDKLLINGGFRYSIFNVLGPGEFYRYAEDQPVEPAFRQDTLTFGRNKVVETYHGPELRFSLRYSLNESSSVKASYNRTRQNIHLLLNAASVAPTDVWRLSSPYIEPQIGDQFSVGYYKNIYGKHLIEASVEAYYKRIQNIVDFKVGSDLQFNEAIESDLLQGNGRAYGLELSLKKHSGWFSGWINYTFSRSLVQLDGNFPDEIINNGEFFPTGYDKPHYINSVTNYKFTRRLGMTLNMVFASGVPVTIPQGRWEFKGAESLFYSNRNEFRIPNYFRVDLGFNIEGNHRKNKLAHSSWSFSIYNVLSRDNLYSVFFKVEDGLVEGYGLTVFPSPIPTLTYNFKF